MRTGSLGITNDLWLLLHYACYEDAEVGHAWEPPTELVDTIRWAEGALDAGYDRKNGRTVPFRPGCKKCRTTAKNRMMARGLKREQVIRLFVRVGARWDWASREKAAEKLLRDDDLCIPDPENPGFTLVSTVKERRRRRIKQMEFEDRKYRIASQKVRMA